MYPVRIRRGNAAAHLLVVRRPARVRTIRSAPPKCHAFALQVGLGNADKFAIVKTRLLQIATR